jgi:polyisoprenoid-binding protein YceI
MSQPRATGLFAGLVLGAASLAVAQPLTRSKQAPEAAAAASGGPARAATYVVDPTHTFVTYEIDHYGTTTNRGRFGTRAGTVKIDASGAGGQVAVTIDVGSIDTGVNLLDRHLQSKDFFNVAAFPEGRFVADRIEFAGDKVARVPGTLTLLGKSRPVTLEAKRFNCYASPIFTRQVCGGDFEAVILRSDYGIVWGLEFGFADRVRLLVQIEAVRTP